MVLPGGRRRTPCPGWPMGTLFAGPRRRDLTADYARRRPGRSFEDRGSTPLTSTSAQRFRLSVAGQRRRTDGPGPSSSPKARAGRTANRSPRATSRGRSKRSSSSRRVRRDTGRGPLLISRRSRRRVRTPSRPRTKPVANVLPNLGFIPILPEHIWGQYATGVGDWSKVIYDGS